MKNFIPYSRQWIDEDDIDEVVKVLRSDYLTTGPKVEEFEELLCQYTGSKYAVSVSNGTAALHCACFAAGIKEGDEVITTPMSFAATSNCILYLGAKPVFVDIDPLTLNIDPKNIESKITNKTKAIICVDFTGTPCELDEIQDICTKYNLILIEDAAHAIGAKYKKVKVGNIADLTTFSFHPVKNITTGEGGAILTNNYEYYKKLKIFRTHGITRDKELMEDYKGPWYYEQQFLGFNYRMTDIQAALGISQLKKIDTFLTIRRHYSNIYDIEFKNTFGITIKKENPNGESARHIYILLIDWDELQIDRNEFYDKFKDLNIGLNVHYIPIYLHPYYKRLGYNEGLCPIAEKSFKKMITIPLHPRMTIDSLEYIIVKIKSLVNLKVKV